MSSNNTNMSNTPSSPNGAANSQEHSPNVVPAAEQHTGLDSPMMNMALDHPDAPSPAHPPATTAPNSADDDSPEEGEIREDDEDSLEEGEIREDNSSLEEGESKFLVIQSSFCIIVICIPSSQAHACTRLCTHIFHRRVLCGCPSLSASSCGPFVFKKLLTKPRHSNIPQNEYSQLSLIHNRILCGSCFASSCIYNPSTLSLTFNKHHFLEPTLI